MRTIIGEREKFVKYNCNNFASGTSSIMKALSSLNILTVTIPRLLYGTRRTTQVEKVVRFDFYMRKNYTKRTIRIFLEEAWKSKRFPIAMFLTVLCGSLIDLVYPIFFKEFFDTLVMDAPIDQRADRLIEILWMMAGVALMSRVCWSVSDYMGSLFHSRTINMLASRCFSYINRHSVSFFNNNFVGSLVKKVSRFIFAFDAISSTFFWDFMPLMVSLVGISVILALQSPFLAAIVAIWAVIVITSTFIFSRHKLPLDIDENKAGSKLSGQLADTFTNQMNVKYFNGREVEQLSYQKLQKVWERIFVKSRFIEGHFRVFQGIMLILLEIGILYMSVELWKQGKFTIGHFALIQAYVITLSDKMWGLKHIIRNYYQNMANADEMTEILETPHEITDRRTAKPLTIKKGEIIFDNVTFAYHKTRTILKKFNLSVKSKQKLALVGHSGAGKSTIVKLMMRQHDVSGGKILIDGQKVSHVTQESLWEQLSFVPQEPILFHRTLIENIRYGKPEATDEEVVEAAKLAHAHDFIAGFPEGYNTFVGERGVKLSGGERQRVAIARAILRNAPILILDEATSSLDSESEALIQKALDNLMKDKTVIVIAHRLSTIQKMDRIVVMDEGKIIEDGKHKTLLKKKTGTYKKLWELQAGGFV